MLFIAAKEARFVKAIFDPWREEYVVSRQIRIEEEDLQARAEAKALREAKGKGTGGKAKATGQARPKKATAHSELPHLRDAVSTRQSLQRDLLRDRF